MEKETAAQCKRCGRCCRIIPLKVTGVTGTLVTYLIERGAYRDGNMYIFPSVCRHLIEHNDGTTSCAIYDVRPVLCRVGPIHPSTYAPRGCVFREES